MMVESMIIEGTSVMEEINAIYVSKDLYSSEDRDTNHGPYVWWSSALGQSLEKILRIFFYQLTGRSLPYIRITRMYESTCVPYRGFNNQLTPVTASFKKRQNKKKQQRTKVADEKERSKSMPKSTPIQNRIGTLKQFRFAEEIDNQIQKTEFSHPSEWNIIHSPPTQLIDETPSTSRRKSLSKSILSRLGGKMPHPGGRGPSGHRSKHGLGGVVHKEQPWEHRMGSNRYTERATLYTECATVAWHVGPRGSPW